MIDGNVEIQGFSENPVVIDVTDPMTPEFVEELEFNDDSFVVPVPEGSTLLAAASGGMRDNPTLSPIHRGSLANTENQADLIILSTTELSPTLQPLADWRQSQGLNVMRASIEDVYNEFGYGEESPNSIRNFIRFALEEWQEPKPRYLLIVGDATYDFRSYLNDSTDITIPSPMVRVAYGGETVSDPRLGDINGDGLSDIAIGRWPIKSNAEVPNLIERTIAYEQGHGSSSILLAADGTSAEFTNLSDAVFEGSGLPADSAVRLYGTSVEQFAEAWNEGAWLATYSGHGSIDRWGKEGVFTADAVPQLDSEGPPPIVLQMTCLTGFFAHPATDSISESMLRDPNGPVQLIAATSLTLSSSQQPFGINFLKALQNPGNERIGDALQESKLALDVENSSALKEISQTFTLLGDPSAMITRPR